MVSIVVSGYGDGCDWGWDRTLKLVVRMGNTQLYIWPVFASKHYRVHMKDVNGGLMSVEAVVIAGGGRQTHAQTPREFLGKCIRSGGLQDREMRRCKDARGRVGGGTSSVWICAFPKNARVAAGSSKIG